MTWELALGIATLIAVVFIALWAGSLFDVMQFHISSVDNKLVTLQMQVNSLKRALEETTKAPLYDGERSDAPARVIDVKEQPMSEFGDERDDWFD